MHVIRTVNTKRFSLNGIEYLKNYVTNVSGNYLEIFNCYDRHDVLLAPTHYNQFVVNGAVYASAGQLQAALADILYIRTTLGAVAADISQDNIDLVRIIRIPTYSMSAILNAINTGDSFTISDTQSVWFSVTTTLRNGSVPRGTVYKYKMKGRGKGDYGSANGNNSPVVLTSANLELVYYSEPTFRSITDAASTVTIDLGVLLPGRSLSEAINARPATSPLYIQPAEEGETILRATINGSLTERLWIGGSGKFGQGAQQASENDLDDLPKESNESTGYDDVLATNSISSHYAEHKDEGQDSVTAYGTAIRHSAENGASTKIVFEQPQNSVRLVIPALHNDDSFAMVGDINKPVKFFYDRDERIINGVYILQPDDYKYWLSFELTDDFMIKVPVNIFPDYSLIEGDVCGKGMAEFKAESPLTLHTGASELARSAEKNSVFGLKFKQYDSVLLFGKLAGK
nr:hypothetical protein [uncultured Flavobacterium sp.]